MKSLLLITFAFSLAGCWETNRTRPGVGYQHVYGNKPVYSARTDAKVVTYLSSALPVQIPGNIYVKGDFIYQLEIGKGIHVIDNSIPSQAHRVGFITVNGSSQISIKNDFIYTNNYDDLLVLRITNGNTVDIIKRVSGAFPGGESNYYYNEPIESGYYECPRQDSVIVAWVKDSIWTSCYKD